ncbi:predicted protein [Nematostella vectensis]|uniref:Uncharacterized protein n=1 Tax=Nematostella vectensis TaxID=45351 RepID=A7S8R5_NEMVE|nr:predicted protein [Nematostella vectensis]|eukprot:XP_001631979.1 predicted protein [Nematostella vectensis]
MTLDDNEPFEKSDDLLSFHYTRDEKVKFCLCLCYTKLLSFDILIPSRQLGSRLLLRSVPKAETPPPEMEEEQRIMVDYLSKALIVNEEGCVDLSCDYPLPDGFDQAYWRRSVRSTYPFNIGGESFEVMISKEEAWDHGKFENKADIHVHCNFWDEKLKEGDWEPEEIASKLPSFLSFVRDVQRNFSLGDEQDGAI